MSLNTETLLALIQSLAENNGDFLTFSTTTNITTNNSIISTTLNQYDDGRDGFFDEWWVYLNTANNVGVLRKTGLPGTTTYAKATGTLTVLGAALADESAAQTCYLFRYNRDRYKEAIIEACKQAYPALHKRIDNVELITGNSLCDGHLESWSLTSALTHWAKASGGTLLQTLTAGLHWGGVYSAKYTAGAANDYIYQTSDSNPELLGYQNKSVNAYAMAYPQTADDATIVIYTKQADGTSQTLTSTTSCPAGEWTILKLENQKLNDDLVDVQVRLKVGTSGQYVYFDDVYFGGGSLSEYQLPDGFINGHLSQVFIQSSSGTSPDFYDQNPFRDVGNETPFHISYDSIDAQKHLVLQNYNTAKRRMRLIGYALLETLSADTDTITIDTQRVPLLIALAKYIFLKRQLVPVSADNATRVQNIIAQAYVDYKRELMKHRMASPIELI